MWQSLFRTIIIINAVMIVAIITVRFSTPDATGDVLAFTIARASSRDNYLLQFYDTGTGVSATTRGKNHSNMIWSPDGFSVAYQTNTQDGHRLIISDFIASSTPAVIDIGNTASDIPMMWSPDGQQIVYSGYQGRVSGVVFLRLLDIHSEEVIDISHIGILENPTFARWMPDGETLLVKGQYPRTASRFGLVNINDSRNPVRLSVALNLFQIVVPFSDSSGFIAQRENAIMVIPVSDLDNAQVVHDRHDQYYDLVLSPDENRVAFISRARSDQLTSWSLSVIDLTTNETKTIITVEGVLRDVAWSADSKWLTYSVNPIGESAMYRDIYIIRPDGSRKRLVAGGFMRNSHPAWQS